MGILCGFIGHKWNHCRCERCGVTMGLGRDEIGHHDWNGCKCRICGQVRDVQHDWDGCKCRICGKTRDAEHRFENGVCKVCGKRVFKEDLLKVFEPGFKYPIEYLEPRQYTDEVRKFLARQLDLAFEALSPEDADDVLVKAYSHFLKTMGKDMGRRPPIIDWLREMIVPHVNASNLLKLYEVPCGNHVNQSTGGLESDFIWLLQSLEKELILEAAEKSGWNAKKKKQFLLDCRVSDGKYVTPCEIGEHDLILDHVYTDEEGDSYEVYHCKRCGVKIERYVR